MQDVTKPKRRLGLALPPPTRGQRIERIASDLRVLDADRAIATIGAHHVDHPLKTTVSLCPSCLEPVPALVFAEPPPLDAEIVVRYELAQ